ncbi:MAG: YcxB family protein [Candidatus Saccharibacteria bacterium]
MELKVKLERSDYGRLEKFIIKHSFWHWLALGIETIVLCFLAAYCFVIWQESNGYVVETFDLVLIVAGTAVVMLPALILAQMEFAKRSVPNSMLGDVTITADESGLMLKNSASETLMAWTAFIDMKEDNQNIFLYTDRNHAKIIPKRGFKSEEELIDFMAILESHLTFEIS